MSRACYRCHLTIPSRNMPVLSLFCNMLCYEVSYTLPRSELSLTAHTAQRQSSIIRELWTAECLPTVTANATTLMMNSISEKFDGPIGKLENNLNTSSLASFVNHRISSDFGASPR